MFVLANLCFYSPFCFLSPMVLRSGFFPLCISLVMVSFPNKNTMHAHTLIRTHTMVASTVFKCQMHNRWFFCCSIRAVPLSLTSIAMSADFRVLIIFVVLLLLLLLWLFCFMANWFECSWFTLRTRHHQPVSVWFVFIYHTIIIYQIKVEREKKTTQSRILSIGQSTEQSMKRENFYRFKQTHQRNSLQNLPELF